MLDALVSAMQELLVVLGIAWLATVVALAVVYWHAKRNGELDDILGDDE